MNKYILADMITPILKKEMNLVDYPLPEELRVREGEHPNFGKVFEKASRYKADKTKRVAFTRLDFGGAFVGSVAMIFGGDVYDFPYVIETLCFVPGEGGKDKIFAEFDAMPLVKDEESMRKYVEPLRGWREAIDKLPSEPVSGLGKPGEFILDSVSQIEVLRFIPIDYLDELLDLSKQFWEIALDFWRKAEPVKDIQRMEKINAYRGEYNRHILEEDPTGQFNVEVFGREKALLYFDNLAFV